LPYDELVKAITSGLSQFRWIADSVDIIIIAVLLYRLIVLTKETRAYQVLKGIGVLFLAAILSDALQLQTVSWMLNSIVASGIIVMVVLFQPELRRALASVGRRGLLGAFSRYQEAHMIDEVVRAVTALASRKIGAILVLERESRLSDIVDSGTPVDAVVSRRLLESIFYPYSPLHDGAVIISNDRIVAGGCFLPLSINPELPRDLGTRHRAAVGVTEESDAIAIAVSEETGAVSLAIGGEIARSLDSAALRQRLSALLAPPPPARPRLRLSAALRSLVK